MKLEMSQQILEKFSNIKFHESPSGATRSMRTENRRTWRS